MRDEITARLRRFPIELPKESFDPGDKPQIRTKKLNDSRGKWQFPTIDSLDVRTTGHLNTGAAGGFGGSLIQMFDSIRFYDGKDPRIECSGSSFRIAMMSEYGAVFRDPPNIPPNLNNVAFDIVWSLPFAPPTAKRPIDFRVTLLDWLAGGKLEFYANRSGVIGPANGITIVDADIIVTAWIVDERSAEAKSRYVIRDKDIQESDDTYICDGGVRQALVYAGEVAENAGSTLPAITVDSQTLEYLSLDDIWLRADYARRRNQLHPADSVVAGYSLPLVSAGNRQHTTELPVIPSLHANLKGFSVVTSNKPKLVFVGAQFRNIDLTARALGKTTNQLLKETPIVNSADGNDRPATHVSAEVAAVLPVRSPVEKK